MPPATPADGVPSAGAIRLVRVRRRAFGDPPGHAGSAADLARFREYLSDLVRPHGLALRESLLSGGGGRAYGTMAESLILATVGTHEPVDLLVMAMAVPDVHPGRATATYLSDVCPGKPMAFTICDQGSAAPFTALRAVRDYAAQGRYRRSLVVVVEQSTLHYETAVPVGMPDRDVAISLLVEAGGPDHARATSVRQHTDVAPAEVASLLSKELMPLAPCTVVLADTLAACAGPVRAGSVEVHLAPVGQPSTGVWWALVDELADPGARRVVLADYEPALRYLSLAVVATGSPC